VLLCIAVKDLSLYSGTIKNYINTDKIYTGKLFYSKSEQILL